MNGRLQREAQAAWRFGGGAGTHGAWARASANQRRLQAEPCRGRRKMEHDTFDNDSDRDDMDDDDEAVPRVPRPPKNGAAKKAKSPGATKESERKKRELITMGKAKGFLTYDEVNDHMPENIVSSDQIDDWLSRLGRGHRDRRLGAKLKVARKDGASDAEAAEEEEDEEARGQEGGAPRRRRRTTATRRPTTRCACTCARWARSRCSPARARSRSPSASRTASGACCRSCSTRRVAIEEILELGDKLRKQKIRVKDVVKDVDEEDAEFDEQWHIERVCKVIDKVRRLCEEPGARSTRSWTRRRSRSRPRRSKKRDRGAEAGDLRRASGAAPQQEADRPDRRAS